MIPFLLQLSSTDFVGMAGLLGIFGVPVLAWGFRVSLSIAALRKDVKDIRRHLGISN